MDTAAGRPILICGPSGCGKTVAAINYVSHQSHPTVWISAGGADVCVDSLLVSLLDTLDLTCVTPPKNASELLRAAGQRWDEAFREGLVVVIDDMGSGRSAGEAPTAVLIEFHRVCSPLKVTVIATTRFAPDDASSCLIVDHTHLRLHVDEVRDLAAILCGPERADGAAVDRAIELAAGHAALTSTVLAAFSDECEGAFPSGPASSRLLDQMAGSLEPSAYRIMRGLCVLRSATLTDMHSVGIGADAETLNSLCAAVPLIRLERRNSGSVRYTAHDMLIDSQLPNGRLAAASQLNIDLRTLLCVLARNREATVLAAVLREISQGAVASDWLSANGEEALRVIGYRNLQEILQSLPLQNVVCSSALLLLWARVLHDVGDLPEALSKARIACQLAEHEHDWSTLGAAGAIAARATAVLRGPDDARVLGESLLARMGDKDPVGASEILVSLAAAAATLGDEAEVESLCARAAATAQNDAAARLISKGVARARGILYALALGDWRRAHSVLQSIIDATDGDMSEGLIARGNSAWCLLQLGRLHRSGATLDSVLGQGHEIAEGAYSIVRAGLCAAAGDRDAALGAAQESVCIARRYGDEVDAEHNRVYLAVIQRAFGMREDSLASAEQAHECLAGLNISLFHHTSAVEVAASLLALGDVDAARAWVTPIMRSRAGGNVSALGRAAMILALCDLRQVDAQKAVGRLQASVQAVSTPNSNWQTAMYCRTFPELLGLLALAVGVERLPSHMLRMVLPENAEVSLRATQSIMPADEWNQLGRRVLGTEQFSDFAERRGRPICRVRLFGGLEVTVGDRVVRERDWTKRKGRLLFTILVAEGGAEVPRDKLLEHLWPDLDAERAKNNFYVAWSTMKSALLAPEERGGECPYVESLRGRCRVITDKVRSDVAEFEDLIRKARVADAEGRGRDAIALYSDLMTVYRGDLLPGDAYDDWFSTLRDGYRREFVDGMLRAVEILLELDDPCEAVLFARRGVSVDPTREDLYQAALRSHIAAGQRSSAIDTFIQCKTKLAEELGLDPSMDTIRLYEQVLVMEEKPRYHPYDEAE